MNAKEQAKILALNCPKLDYSGSYTLKQFLEEKNIIEPKILSDDKIVKIFNRILFYVNSHENYKFMKQSFALALSDEEDSMEYFELFINNATPSLKKLEMELGINNKTDAQPVNKINREDLTRQMELITTQMESMNTKKEYRI